MRRLLIAAALAVAAPAWGFSAGAPGFSGAGSMTCNDCHTGGVAPKVTITGADALAPGETQTYVIVVSSATPMFQKFAGIDVSASAGTLAAHPAQNSDKLAQGEVVQDKTAGPFATLQFQFDLTAPSQPGPVTLFGDGLSCDGNGATDGDAAATTTKVVQVVAGIDMAGATPDLSVVDAMSGATPQADAAATSMLKREPTWACECRVGGAPRAGPGGFGMLALIGLAWLGVRALRPRRRRR